MAFVNEVFTFFICDNFAPVLVSSGAKSLNRRNDCVIDDTRK